MPKKTEETETTPPTPTPPPTPDPAAARIAELEAEVARLKAAPANIITVTAATHKAVGKQYKSRATTGPDKDAVFTVTGHSAKHQFGDRGLQPALLVRRNQEPQDNIVHLDTFLNTHDEITDKK